MKPVHYDDVSKLRKQIKALYRRLQREFSGVEGLTYTTYQILRSIDRATSPISPGRLCDELEMTTPNVAAALRILEGKGLVIRQKDPADGRRASLETTAAGDALLAKTRGSPSAWLKTAMENALTPEEQREMLDAGELIERLALYVAPPPTPARRREGMSGGDEAGKEAPSRRFSERG